MLTLRIFECKREDLLPIKLQDVEIEAMKEHGIFYIPLDVIHYPRLISSYLGMDITGNHAEQKDIITEFFKSTEIGHCAIKITASPPMHNESWISTDGAGYFSSRSLSAEDITFAKGERLPIDYQPSATSHQYLALDLDSDSSDVDEEKRGPHLTTATLYQRMYGKSFVDGPTSGGSSGAASDGEEEKEDLPLDATALYEYMSARGNETMLDSHQVVRKSPAELPGDEASL